MLEALAQVPDPRRRRGVRHPFAALLAIAVCAMLSGARSFAAIGEWAAPERKRWHGLGQLKRSTQLPSGHGRAFGYSRKS
ncbi:transposase family protein [Candidatus Protofrankia californiensis]|uniref:transposase family protein n=1 Tax=Candidatus Protofrankia californiensis TaxID=1839754 RepID=UPI001F49BC89|nr:transposase family protein [Candidatus Protofrankia californiensis]